MNLFNYEECLVDCDKALTLLKTKQNLPNKELFFIKLNVRKAMCLCWKGCLVESKNIFASFLEN